MNSTTSEYRKKLGKFFDNGILNINIKVNKMKRLEMNEAKLRG